MTREVILMSTLFAEALNRAGLTQKQFTDIVNNLSGCKPLNRQRTSHWAKEGTGCNETAIALAELLSRMSPTERSFFIKE